MANSNSKKNTSSKKKSGSKKSNTKSKQKNVGRNGGKNLRLLETNRNLVMLIYLASGVLLGCFAFIHGSNIWETVRSAFFAFFGVSFYLLIAFLIVTGIRIALGSLKFSLLKTNFSAVFLISMFASLLHLFCYSFGDGGFAEWGEQFVDAMETGWDMGMTSFHWTGGILGAVFGGLSLTAFGKAGAYVVIVVLLIVSVFICFGISLNSVGNLVSRFINGSKEKIDSTSEQTKIAMDEKRREREERKRLRLEQLEQEALLRQQEAENKEEADAQEESISSHGDIFDFNETEIENDPLKKDTTAKKSDFTVHSAQEQKPISKEAYKRSFRPYRPDENVFTYPDKNAGERRTSADIKFTDDDLISKGAHKPSSPFSQPVNQMKVPPQELPLYYEEITEEAEESNDGFPDDFEAPQAELSRNAKKIVRDAADTAAAVRKKNIDEVNNYVEDIKPKKEYMLPPIDCLNEPKFGSDEDYALEMKTTARKLVDVLKSFGVETKLIGVSRGPSVTRYELSPAPGVKISKITNLADDIALGLASSGVRIEAPIPNKSAVGIEVPNKSRATVTMREMVSSEEYKKGKNNGKLLNVALGKDITGNITCADLSKMPHLLIAGTTGSGKSVCLNVMIASILYNATPSQVKLLMIDPKQVEFTVYNGIPHLLVPVISDARKAAGSLAWAVGEMDSRYKTFSNCAVRDISSYNKYAQEHPELNLQYMPQIVIFIDELNDLMMVSPKEVEDSICRLAQKARAAGMHLVVATQRPSVDVITGIIKANIPSRISLSVSSQVDSRTILDAIGAEKLLGNGDMLFNPVGMSKPVRIQGAYLSDTEIDKIVTFIKEQENAEYDDGIMEEIEKNAVVETKKKSSQSSGGDDDDNQYDVLIEEAMGIVTELNSASTTVLQRKLSVGYARAARIMDQLEQLGYISPAEGNKPRRVLVSRAQYLEMRAGADNVSSDDFDVLSD